MILILLLSLVYPTEQTNPYCKVFGSFYEVEEPYLADYIVYEEGSEGSADVIVFEQKNRLFADKPGMWSFESKKEFATHTVFFTDREREAHFSVYFTRFESFAGCNE